MLLKTDSSKKDNSTHRGQRQDCFRPNGADSNQFKISIFAQKSNDFSPNGQF